MELSTLREPTVMLTADITMKLSILGDPTVMLTDYTNSTPWMEELKGRCKFLKVWDLVDPDNNKIPRSQPQMPTPPKVEGYQPKSDLANEDPDDDSPPVPKVTSDLSTIGRKEYGEDMEYYELLVEVFKISDRNYREEKAKLEKVALDIQATASSHLQRNCCRPGKTIREWIKSLMETVGVDKEYEQARARTQYLQALKPMRKPSDWFTWLLDYDHAATEAEKYNVPELQSIHDVAGDFVGAIMKTTPIWGTSFLDSGRREADMNRNTMMQRFRSHMIYFQPLEEKRQKGTFAAAGPSRAAGGTSTSGTDTDASQPAKSAPFIKRGRPGQKRSFGQGAVPKQSWTNDTATGRGQTCPACDLRHSLKNCFYAFPDKAPNWFNPRPGYSAMVKHRIENDSDLQEDLRNVKRIRSQPPRIKQSHTPTPEFDEQ